MHGKLHSTRTALRLGLHTAWRTVIFLLIFFFIKINSY